MTKDSGVLMCECPHHLTWTRTLLNTLMGPNPTECSILCSLRLWISLSTLCQWVSMHVHLSVVSSLVFPECPAVVWCTIPLSGSAAGLGERVELGRNCPASVRAGLFVCTHNNGWAGKSHLCPPLKVQSLGRVSRREQTREGRGFF